MKLEEIESAIEDKSIYSFNKQQLAECLKIVAAADVGGNPNFHARLSKVNVFLTYLATDLSSREQLRETTKTANKAITIAMLSIIVSIILTVANWRVSDKSSKETTDQLTAELRKIHKEEQRIFSCISTVSQRSKQEESKHSKKETKK